MARGCFSAPNGTPQLANVPVSRLQGQPGVALGDRRLQHTLVAIRNNANGVVTYRLVALVLTPGVQIR